MAAEVTTMPGVNGYAPHQGYGGVEPSAQVNAYSSTPATTQSAYSQPPPATSGSQSSVATGSTAQGEIPKDEVGWYFVEQYYTTLSRSPEKLYLFYNKRSQFVSGQEADKVAVCVGQRAINDRIKELDFHECKVRVTNVDSQASDANIVIQVIGEMSNKSQPRRKFTQTFVLAAQTNGYFVLNDIFRYLIEEEDETEQEMATNQEEIQLEPPAESGYQEPAPTAEEAEPKTLTSSMEPAAIEHDAKVVDKELEEKVLKVDQSEALKSEPVNGVQEKDQTETSKSEDGPAAAVTPAEDMASSAQPSVEADIPAEKPKDPTPSPARPIDQPSPPTPPASQKPSAPKTWANLAAAANRVATPATPAVSAQAQPPKAGVPKPSTTVPSASAQQQVAPTPAAQRESNASPVQEEWSTVGASHNRQQSRQVNAQQQEQGPQHRGYIKNVHEGIKFDEMKNYLAKFGELAYFDIARQKNCAFVDFKTAEGYQKAVDGNPHKLGDDTFYVEERRVRPGSTPYVPRGNYQGGRGNRGGGMQGAPRGNFQSNRSGFTPRGRGG
ncbi:hypothetical protein M433DRAFT_33458, partial [Acidomyces richmondensis BFW]